MLSRFISVTSDLRGNLRVHLAALMKEMRKKKECIALSLPTAHGLRTASYMRRLMFDLGSEQMLVSMFEQCHSNDRWSTARLCLLPECFSMPTESLSAFRAERKRCQSTVCWCEQAQRSMRKMDLIDIREHWWQDNQRLLTFGFAYGFRNENLSYSTTLIIQQHRDELEPTYVQLSIDQKSFC